MNFNDVLYFLIVTLGSVTAITMAIGLPLKYSFNKRKLLEEHRTNNLALAYQILQARPEVTINDVQNLIESTDQINAMLTDQRR